MDRIDHLPRRAFLGGALATSGVVLLPGCASMDGISFTEAIRRLLVLSSERAFTRLTAAGGFWDESVARLGLEEFLGTRGNVLASILTSSLFKSRLEGVVADLAVDASYRAAPIVADTVRTIGIANAVALVRGGPTAATGFLRGEMGPALFEALAPDVAQALRVAQEPLVGQLLNTLTGVDVANVANTLSSEIETIIWDEIGREEAGIRADPAATRDPVLIAVFGTNAALQRP